MDFKLPCNDEKHVKKVIHFIREQERARNRDPEEVCNNGDCGEVFWLLYGCFHCAKPVLYPMEQWYEHTFAEIGGKRYDIRYEENTDLTPPTNDLTKPNVKRAINLLSFNYKEPEDKTISKTSRAREKMYMSETYKNLQEYIKTEEFLK